MTLREEAIQTVFLKPGEAHVAFSPCEVVTILGSCVAVCLHASGIGAGSICHATLPCREDMAQKENPLCFVDYAVAYMLDQLHRRGVSGRDLVVGLFGGADVYPIFSVNETRRSVGRQNINTAQGMISRFCLRLAREETGGVLPYRLRYRPHTGQVMVERIGGEEKTHREVSG